MPTHSKLAAAATYRQQVEQIVTKYCEAVAPTALGSAYLEVLNQNTERLQGSLVLVGYDLQGGKDVRMIEQAALAVELLHAYVQCMEQGVDQQQALRAQHEAQIILANLEADEENRLKALSITNRTLMLATLARLPQTSETDALNWRATELALNPLHVGQVLADADCRATNRVTPEAITFGKSIADERNPELSTLLKSLTF